MPGAHLWRAMIGPTVIAEAIVQSLIMHPHGCELGMRMHSWLAVAALAAALVRRGKVGTNQLRV